MDRDDGPLREWHLRYRYAGAEWGKVLESHGLGRDDREIVLEVLRRHFDAQEAGWFAFEWFDPATLSALERARPKPGPLESGDLAKSMMLALSTTTSPIGELTDEERRALRVRDAAAVIVGEIHALAREGVLARTGRDELIAHLLTLDLHHPPWLVARPDTVRIEESIHDRPSSSVLESRPSRAPAPPSRAEERTSNPPTSSPERVPTDLLTFKEAALHCGCAPITIKRAVRVRTVLREYDGMVSKAELDANRARVVLRQHRTKRT